MDYATLARAVDEDAALRRKQLLQPIGGKGDKIFPPTYPASEATKRAYGERNAPPRHVFEQRRINGATVPCVLIDSVQSQANRLEEALLAAVQQRLILLPYVTVDFRGTGLSGITEITSLDAPHRVYDAILRDSSLNGKSFMKSELGTRLAEAKPADATVLLETSPTALLFGAWHSTGEGGGLGAKFPRCLVSEIVGVGVPIEDGPADPRTGEIEVRTSARRTGSRIDPLGVLASVAIYQSKDDSTNWTPVESDAATRGANNEPILFSRKKGDKAGRPSVINHGNVTPSVQPLGVTCDHVEHTAVLSFAGLRRLGFGGGEKDAAGRVLLAALGIVALAEQDAGGYALRSRCDLVCDGRAPFELVHANGSGDHLDIDRKTARTLYVTALETARKAGFNFPAEPTKLVPQNKLIEIVRRSQGLALKGEGGEADEQAEN
jgi:CRISPR-associated protein Csb1